MNAIVVLFLLGILMIISFGVALSGGMLWLARPQDGALIPLLMIGIGGTIGGLSLWYLIRINNAFQRAMLRKVLANPASILVEWKDELGQRIIFTENDLFIDTKHYPFKAFYQKLTHLYWQENQDRPTIYLAFVVLSNYNDARPSFNLVVPAHALDACRQAVEKIVATHLSPSENA